MTKFLARTMSLFFGEIIIFSLIFFILFDGHFNQWKTLWEEKYWNLPVAILFLILLFAISLSISIGGIFILRQQSKTFENALHNIEKSDPIPPNWSGSLSIQKSLNEISELIATQRKSLQKLTNDKAVNQDQLIQERIVQERHRLARELHDSVSQQLFAASMLLSTINETAGDATPSTKKLLKQSEEIVQQAQLEMRALLLHLRPVALKNKSLKQGLEELLAELQQKVTFKMHKRLEEVSLSKGAEDHLFRIAQETLSNTLRHAKATEMELLLVERDQRVIFRVQDNGIGFKTTDEKAGSYGLHNIEERAVEIGGTYKIVSVPSQGTVIEIQIPVEKEVISNDQDTASR